MGKFKKYIFVKNKLNKQFFIKLKKNLFINISSFIKYPNVSKIKQILKLTNELKSVKYFNTADKYNVNNICFHKKIGLILLSSIGSKTLVLGSNERVIGVCKHFQILYQPINSSDLIQGPYIWTQTAVQTQYL